jgi:ssDNA-binding replication factor A large subunit
MMYDFDGLVDEVLRNKPDMSREDIIEMIEDKKRNVGAGYLTDQGALFLIAGELGVQLKPMTSDLTLKDLHAGANDITIVARVLAVYPISEYKRKDGGTGKYRRVNLFDSGNVVRLTIWDDNQDALKLDGVSEDTPIRISNGYVRPGLDGKPNLNLGRRGRIDVIGDAVLVDKMVSLSKLSRKPEDVGDDQNIMALEGVASSNSRSSSFVRGDGSQGSLMQFDVSGEGGKGNTRVVVWNPGAVPEVSAGQSVLVTNLRVKKGNTGEREFHGDSGSAIRIQGPGSAAVAISFTKVNQVKGATGRMNLEVMALSKGTADDVNMKDGTKAKKAELVIGDDTGEITMIGWRGAAELLSGIEIGQKVRIIGATRQLSRMGVETLQLETDSKIEKIPG